MGRLVRKPKLPETETQASEFGGMFQSRARPVAAVADPGDDYLLRMAKYVPGEVLGFSMVVNAILAQAMASGGGAATMAGFAVSDIAIGALILGCILTPLFCWYVRQDGDAWVVNAVVSTIAFPFWSYLMGAVAFDKIHDGNLAVILILTVTAVSGLVAPVPAARQQQEQKSANPKEGPRLVESLKA
ncbi:MAG TPA: hypothetical protein VEK75_07730 [Xanthobacteraceae bacterium]|nr:hypothetical protein [Xanthobacteraceae bacterium]